MRIDCPAENPSVPCAARRCTGTVQGQPGANCRPERVPTDEIAAMDHGCGALRGGRADGAAERFGPVVAVGNDADFHAPIIA
jgi:hypothetical protein